MVEPTTLLVAPSGDNVVPNLANNILGGSQYISPSYWINWVINQTFSTNPLELVTKTFAGDWNAVAQAGRALECLGAYCDEVAAQLHTGNTLAAADWDGQAADASYAYFSGLSSAIQEQADAMRSAGGEYRSVCVGMQQMAVLLDSLLRQAMDLMIIAAVSAAATAAAAAGLAIPGAGLVAVASATTTGAMIARALPIAKEALGVHDIAVNLCNGATGLIAGYLGALQGFETTALPASYDNKVVD